MRAAKPLAIAHEAGKMPALPGDPATPGGAISRKPPDKRLGAPASRRLPLGIALLGVFLLASPAHAMPGDELYSALRWLRSHPFLGPARLAPVEGLGPILVFDAWQAGRALPGGGSVRLFLDVVEPQPAPPVKHEWMQNRVKREILQIEQGPQLAETPPVGDLLGRIYTPAVADDYRAAEPIPVGPDEISSGTVIGTLDTGPLTFENGELRKGARFDYLEAWYRGQVGLIQRGARGPEIRRAIVIVTPASGRGTTQSFQPGTLQGQRPWSHAASSSPHYWSSPLAPGLRPASSFRSGR